MRMDSRATHTLLAWLVPDAEMHTRDRSLLITISCSHKRRSCRRHFYGIGCQVELM